MNDLHPSGTLATSRANGKLFIITKVIDVQEILKIRINRIQGYRVALCEDMSNTFVVNAVDFDNRFEVIV